VCLVLLSCLNYNELVEKFGTPLLPHSSKRARLQQHPHYAIPVSSGCFALQSLTAGTMYSMLQSLTAGTMDSMLLDVNEYE
jgi:hypothetical protein